MNRKLSELIDCELTDQQQSDAVDELSASRESAQSWVNYHLIGNIMRGEISSAGSDLSARISQAVDREPTVLAPAAIAKQLKDSTPANDIWRPIAMFAVAASIALVAVFVVNPLPDSTSSKQLVVTEEVDSGSGEIITDEKQLFAQEFGEMLSVHGEFSATSGLNGLVAYAKLVSNEPLKQ